MATSESTRLIAPGTDEYAAVLADWLRNMSPYQFDRMRSDGGMEIIHCPNYLHATQPDFHVMAEAGPTLFPEDAPGDGPATFGFIPQMLTFGGLRFQKSGQSKLRKLTIRGPLLPREPME